MQLVFKSQKAEYFVANCFSSPAGHKRANEPVNPFTVGTCRASGGLQGGFPAEKPQAWEKGCSKCTLLEYPLVIIFSCPPSISFAIDVFYADWKIFRELKA